MADTSASLKNGAPEISSGAPVHKGSKMANPFKKLTAGSGSRTEILAMIGVGLVFLAIWEFLPPLLDVPRRSASAALVRVPRHRLTIRRAWHHRGGRGRFALSE